MLHYVLYMTPHKNLSLSAGEHHLWREDEPAGGEEGSPAVDIGEHSGDQRGGGDRGSHRAQYGVPPGQGSFSNQPPFWFQNDFAPSQN